MRLIIVAVTLFVICVTVVLMQLRQPTMPDGTVFYQGAGETNLDLASPDNTLYLDLKDGRVVIRMRPDLAPIHVARIKELTRAGFYDGLLFHRVITGFMAQTGDPQGTGKGGSGTFLKAEFSPERYKRGGVGMARAGHNNSADSQFFIMFDRAGSLDGKYTLWGEVIEGMEHVDMIKRGAAAENGLVSGEPDKIIRMHMASDAK